MPYLHRKNAKIYYEVLGTSGPWITFINGHTRSSRDFRLLASQLSELPCRSLIFDNRGSGETESSYDFSLYDIADDIQGLWDELGIEKSFVMGLSMGGLIAAIVCHQQPNKTQGLILISTGSSEKSLSQAAHSSWGHSEQDVMAKLSQYFSEEFLTKNRLLVQSMSKQIFVAIKDGDFEQRAHSQRRAMSGIDTSPYLRSITSPCLIIHGDQDLIIPIQEGEKIATLIPHAEFKALSHMGHLLLAEYNRGLKADLIAFIRRHNSSG